MNFVSLGSGSIAASGILETEYQEGLSFEEAKALGLPVKAVLLGPLSFLWLGKEKVPGFERLSLLERLLPVYGEILVRLRQAGRSYREIRETVGVTDATITDALREIVAPIPSQFRRVLKSLHRTMPTEEMARLFPDEVGGNDTDVDEERGGSFDGDSGTRRPSHSKSKAKTYENLPPDDKKACDRMVG